MSNVPQIDNEELTDAIPAVESDSMTEPTDANVTSRWNDRLRMCGSTALTYGAGLWIVLCNPYFAAQTFHLPIASKAVSLPGEMLLGLVFLIIGSTPVECILRVAAIAMVVQAISAFTVDEDDIDLEHYRPYVFWRAIYRFLSAVYPFLSRRRLDAPPSSSLTEYERITVRYQFVKLIFVPMMITFFFGNLQYLINNYEMPFGHFDLSSPQFIRHLYICIYVTLMMADVAWFAMGCTMETRRYSTVKMVDPYASGWLMCLSCYPPLVAISGQFLIWSAPEFPTVTTAGASLFYAFVGLALFTFYVIADFSFGLKPGNLTYRGLVDKGPYRWIRHPMYASKNLAWCIFTVPALNFHLQAAHLSAVGAHISVPMLSANWTTVWPMLAWMTIYALRGITEERYLLRFPEYREYCKRVRHRYIPGVI